MPATSISYLFSSIVIFRLYSISGLIYDQGVVDHSIMNNDLYHVSEDWCQLSASTFEDMNYLYKIPRRVNASKKFSSIPYYLSTILNSGLSVTIKQYFQKINMSTEEIWYKTELRSETIHDISLALLHGAQYYVDVHLDIENNLLKYICPRAVRNNESCYNFQTYLDEHINNQTNLVMVRIMVALQGIQLYDIYQRNELNYYAVERSVARTNINKLLLPTNNFDQPFELILKMSGARANWSDVISTSHVNYRSIRHNIVLVLRDCINQSSGSQLKGNTNKAFMKTYVSSIDDLCDIVGESGIYNLLYSTPPQPPIYLDNLWLLRKNNSRGEIILAFYPNFDIQYNNDECYHEAKLYDAKAIDQMRQLDFDTLIYKFNYTISINGSMADKVIKITYVDLTQKELNYYETTLSGFEYRQRNEISTIIFKNEYSILSSEKFFLLVSYRYRRMGYNNASNCQLESMLTVTTMGENSVRKHLNACDM